MKLLKPVILGALLAASATVLIAQSMEERFPETFALKGKAMPSVTFTGLDGKKFTNKDLLGKVVLIDVWATWCGPCRAAAPKLQKIHEEMAKDGVVILGANAGERGQGGQPVSAEEYMKRTTDYVNEHKYTYKFATNADDVKTALKVRAFPSFFLVDRKGTIREIFVGFNEAGIRAALSKAAAEK